MSGLSLDRTCFLSAFPTNITSFTWVFFFFLWCWCVLCAVSSSQFFAATWIVFTLSINFSQFIRNNKGICHFLKAMTTPKLDQGLSKSDGAYGGTQAVVAVPQASPEEIQSQAGAAVRKVRLSYGLILLAGFALGLIVKNELVGWILKWQVKAGGCDSSECIGDQAVYRVCFCLTLFFLIHALLSSKYTLCLNAASRGNV